MAAIPAAADDSLSANPSSASVKSDDGSSRVEGGNKSFTNSCLHQFCFKRLVTLSKTKTECPLCKQNFKSIIHKVKSNHQDEEFPVQQRRDDNYEHIVAAPPRATLTISRDDSTVFQQMLMPTQGVSSVLDGSGMVPRPRHRSSPTSFRRTVYRHNLWARPLPDFTGRLRECTPEFYRYNDSQVRRLVPWLNRELHYLLNENVDHIAYVVARILKLLPQYHITSIEFRDALQRSFCERTDHFQHELYVFASTPYDLTGYDRNVQYRSDTRLSTTVNEVPSGSDSDGSVDSDIVLVSSSYAGELRTDHSRAPAPAPAPVYPLGAGLKPRVDDRVKPIESISHSDTDDSSEVMVVGYIKPPHQRTPEVVDLLSSDSDVLVQDPPTDPPPAPFAASSTPVNLVKLKLTRQRSSDTPDSDSDEWYTPPPPAPPPPERRRRLTRASATTNDTDRGTSPSSLYSPPTTRPTRTATSRTRPCFRPRRRRHAGIAARDLPQQRATRTAAPHSRRSTRPPLRGGSWPSSSSTSSCTSSSCDSSLNSSSYSPRRRSSPASFRRTVYRHNLWARPLPDFTGRLRKCTPEFYRYNDAQLHRLVPWLNRELHYLLNENVGHVLVRILELLPQYHIKSIEFRDALQQSFRERTDHFQHELYVFASTPYDLTGYDRNVQYSSDTRLSTTVNEVPSGSDSDNMLSANLMLLNLML